MTPEDRKRRERALDAFSKRITPTDGPGRPPSGPAQEPKPVSLDEARHARGLERRVLEHLRGEDGHRPYEMNEINLRARGASERVRRMVIRRLTKAGYVVTERWGGFTVSKP
jgi:hypothetical protein